MGLLLINFFEHFYYIHLLLFPLACKEMHCAIDWMNKFNKKSERFLILDLCFVRFCNIGAVLLLPRTKSRRAYSCY